MDFFDRLEPSASAGTCSSIPSTSAGAAASSSREELAFYAGEYRHAVVALAEAMRGRRRAAEPAVRAELERARRRGGRHVELWDDFAARGRRRPRRAAAPETARVRGAWTAGDDRSRAWSPPTPSSRASRRSRRPSSRAWSSTTASRRARPPSTSRSTPSATTSTPRSRGALIEERLDGADADRLLEVAERRADEGNWALLDGVGRHVRPLARPPQARARVSTGATHSSTTPSAISTGTASPWSRRSRPAARASAPAAGERPRGEREEQGRRARDRVGEQAEQHARRCGVQLRREAGGGAPST